MPVTDNAMRELKFETSVGSNFQVDVSIDFETSLPQFLFTLEGGAKVIFSEADLIQLKDAVLPLVQQAYTEDAVLLAAEQAAEAEMAGTA